MTELLGLDFDDSDAPDHIITSLYQVGNAVLSIRQNPSGGRQHAPGYDQLSAEQSATTTLSSALEASDGYRSNTPNVGWLIWSSTFVLARHLLQERASWEGVRVLELGAGVGLLGLALAKHGAHVTLTDLPHVTPLTRQNVQRNFGGGSDDDGVDAANHSYPRVVDYMWGNADQLANLLPHQEDAATALFPVVLAADCVYEQQHYPSLLCALQQTVVPGIGRAYVCYKRRRLRQELFQAAAREAGWVVEEVAMDDDDYCLLVLEHAVDDGQVL